MIPKKKLKVQKQQQKSKTSHKSKSLYEKYQCQYKKKSILTKLNSDSGYPQDVLQCRGQAVSCSSNYVEQNKRNLKNFFKERIPAQNKLVDQLMKRQSDFVHPRRVFQMRQLQFQLKYQNKFNLKNQFDLANGPNISTTFDKFDANFHVNDKNKQLKEKYGGEKESFIQYDHDNFRRGTQSHIEKRSKILKKEAYDKVFGPDVSSMSRTTGFEKKSYFIEATPPRAKSISLSSPYKEGSNHKNLKNLIHKMHDYKNKLQQSDDPLKMVEQKAEAVGFQENMVELIQNMTKIYQQRSINQGNTKLQTLEDIKKLNKNFYKQMQTHKNNRLSKRRQLAFKTVPLGSDSSNTSSPIKKQKDDKIRMDSCSQISGRDSDEQQNEIEQNNKDIERTNFLNIVSYRFQLLKKTLVKWAALFYIYGIQKQDIYSAFKINRSPYDLQGSYAFFKFIKNGDLSSVQLFLKNNRKFIFQVQVKGKTPLIYAANYNQTQIAKTILNTGVNSDIKCYKGYSPLYYAILKRNVELVKLLLQKGASPWSTQKNPYFRMIQEGENAQQLKILFNNSKKIYIGMQLQPSIQKKKAFWDKTFHKITQTDYLTYENFQ